MRRFFEAKAPRDPVSSSDEGDASARSSVLMSASSKGGGGGGGARAHGRGPQVHKPAGPPAVTFTTNSSILGTTTTTIIPKSGRGGGGGGDATPSSSAAPTAVEASDSGDVSRATTASTALPLDAKTHKKCSVCGKSFNPLRRRHYCRTCTAVVCSSCSISRKVESTFEGAITVRMCVSCKLSAIASQDDFYDRIFASGAAGPPGHGHPGAPPSDGFTGSERLSVASYASNSNASSAGAAASTDPQLQPTSGTMDKRAASASNLLTAAGQPPLRRKSSAVSSARRDSLGSNSAANTNSSTLPGADEGLTCPLCHNEACAPIREYADVPYPFFFELADPNASTRGQQFVAARPLENEKERLRSVRALRNALKLSTVPGSQTTLTQLCSMAAIATTSPLAIVGLLDKHVYAPVAETGIGHLDKIDRHKALAAHTCRNGGPLVCSELARDVRFANNPWARDSMRAGFYAGIPLTLSNGHVVGAVEVFDIKPRYACMDVVAQLQAVVRGLQRKLDEILAKAPAVGDEVLDGRASPVRAVAAPGSGQRRTDSVDSSHSSHSTHHSSHNSKRGSRPPPPSAPVAPPIPPPKKLPSPVQEPPKERPAPPPAPVVSDSGASAPARAPAPTPTPTPAPAPAPAPAADGQEKPGEAPANDMELRLMELLSQTTSTQEQLRNQQSNMVHAISSHSKQIGELAKQLQRMETTLASKLGGDLGKDDADEDEVEAEAPPATAAA